MRDFQDDTQHRAEDAMETMKASPALAQSDSASSEADAGLDDAGLDELMGREDEDENIVFTGIQEIPMSDLDDDLGGTPPLASPELADLSSPGEVDIEDLDEGDLDSTNLPADARLDRLED